MTTALGSVQSDAVSAIVAIVPIAAVVMGAIFAVRMAIKAFKTASK